MKFSANSYSSLRKMCTFVLQLGYMAGYGIAAMELVQLFYMCEMGEHVDVSCRWNLTKWIVVYETQHYGYISENDT